MILQKAFEKLPIILAQVGSDFTLAINISAREFYDPAYNERFLEMADDFAVDPKHIELEITETHIMHNIQKAISNMQRLQQKGFHIAIDDFGTGYSSLNYLKLFPISKLKIDKSFVVDAIHDSGDRAIVQSSFNWPKFLSLQYKPKEWRKKSILICLWIWDAIHFKATIVPNRSLLRILWTLLVSLMLCARIA